MVRIRAVMIGKAAPLGRRGVSSGIDKQPQEGPVRLCRNGFPGDEHGSANHGGPEKAAHHYPLDHYALWRRELPDISSRLRTGSAFGENISAAGMTEAEVCVGDIYRIGGAVVQVSQGRQPCWRLDEWLGEPHMARRVQDTGRTGWYYRVLEEGDVGVGDDITLVERPATGWSLQRISHLLYRDVLNLEELSRLEQAPELSEGCRALVRRRLERRTVEDWSPRLRPPRQEAPS